MMTLLFHLIILTTIWVLGITIVTQPNMGLHSLRRAAESKKLKVMEPLILCHWCMPTFHSLVGYLFAIILGLIDSFDWRYLYMYPLVIMGSSFLCGILWAAYINFDTQSNYYETGSEYYEATTRKINIKYPPKTEEDDHDSISS